MRKCSARARPPSSVSPPTATTSPSPPARCSTTSARTSRSAPRRASGASSPPTSALRQEWLARQPQHGYDINGNPLECRATTRRGTPCQRMPLPTTATARRTSTSPRPRRSSSSARWPRRRDARRHAAAPIGSAADVGRMTAHPRVQRRRAPTEAPRCLGVDVGGTFTDAVLAAGGSSPRRRRRRPTTSPRGSWPPSTRRSSARRRRGATTSSRAFAHGMTVATTRCSEGAAARTVLVRDGGLHRRRRARPPGARATSTGSARPRPRRSRRAARAPERRAPGPTASCARSPTPAPRRGRAAREPEAVAVVLLHAYAHPAHERAIGAALRRARCPTSTSRSRTRSSARSASTSAPRRPRSTPRSRRCWPATCAGCSSGGEAGLPEPRDHAVQRRAGRGRAAPPATPRSPCCRGPAGGAAAAALVAAAQRAARPRVLRHGRHVVRRLRRRGRRRARDRRRARSAGGRSRCRWSTSTRSAPAAARSRWRDPGGALRVGPRSAGRRARARLLRPRRRPSRR